jgi:hypothetical protein
MRSSFQKLQELDAFLEQCTPMLVAQLQRNLTSRAFDSHEVVWEEQHDSVDCLHSLKHTGALAALSPDACTAVAWNAPGTVVAAAYGALDKNEWLSVYAARAAAGALALRRGGTRAAQGRRHRRGHLECASACFVCVAGRRCSARGRSSAVSSTRRRPTRPSSCRTASRASPSTLSTRRCSLAARSTATCCSGASA